MRKLNLLLTLVALSLATTSLWAKPAVADENGKLPAKFSVSSTKQVYFSQGNLQYIGSESPHYWKFADEQYQCFGATSGKNRTNTLETTDRDLFYDSEDAYCTNISNGGGNKEESGWRYLTKDEWYYLVGNTTTKPTDPNIRANCLQLRTFAQVNGVNGLIILPDCWTLPAGISMTYGVIDDFYQNHYSIAQWEILESAGAVFMPMTGIQDEYKNMRSEWLNQRAFYAILVGASFIIIDRYSWNGIVFSYASGWARAIRLVKTVSNIDPLPVATIAEAPAAISDLAYTGSAQTLVSAGTAGMGTMMYSLDGSNYSSTLPKGTNASTYTVYFKAGGECFTSSDPQSIEVTIARASFTPDPMQTVEAASLTYTGSAQDLVTVSGSLQSGCEIQYSTDGVNWSTTIPQGTDAGDYTVYYKVVNDPNYEYIPSPDHIDVTIAPANIVLPAIETDLIYTGSPLPLISIGTIPEGTMYYSTDGINWTTEVPTATEIGAYDVWYKVDSTDPNYNSIPATQVTININDAYPFVTDTQTAEQIEAVLATNPTDLKVKRTIYADDEYNTICLPFALNESALAASPLAGFNRLKTFKGAQVTGTAPDLYIDIFVEDATTIEAGVPYLITYPSAHADIVDPVFNSITVTTTTPSAVSVDGITFQGMFAQVHIDPYDAGHTQDYLFVGANSQLYWPLSTQTSSDIKMRGFRAYFIIDRNSITPALAPKGTRARIMDAPKTTTGIENTSATFGGSEKIIENGILYIIRNGVKYNAQGQIVK